MHACPSCGHKSHGLINAACPCCYRVAVRPSWYAADADDLRVYYTKTEEGAIVTTTTGQAMGYV